MLVVYSVYSHKQLHCYPTKVHTQKGKKTSKPIFRQYNIGKMLSAINISFVQCSMHENLGMDSRGLNCARSSHVGSLLVQELYYMHRLHCRTVSQYSYLTLLSSSSSSSSLLLMLQSAQLVFLRLPSLQSALSHAACLQVYCCSIATNEVHVLANPHHVTDYCGTFVGFCG